MEITSAGTDGRPRPDGNRSPNNCVKETAAAGAPPGTHARTRPTPDAHKTPTSAAHDSDRSRLAPRRSRPRQPKIASARPPIAQRTPSKPRRPLCAVVAHRPSQDRMRSEECNDRWLSVSVQRIGLVLTPCAGKRSPGESGSCRFRAAMIMAANGSCRWGGTSRLSPRGRSLREKPLIGSNPVIDRSRRHPARIVPTGDGENPEHRLWQSPCRSGRLDSKASAPWLMK